VPRSTIVHVSTGPPCHPGQSAFPSPVGDHDYPCAAFPIGWRLKCSLTYTPHHTVCHTARQSAAVVHQTQALRPVVVPVSDRHGREPLHPAEVLPCRSTMPGTLGSITHPSSLLRAHAPDQDPPTSLGCPSVSGSVQVVASPCWALALPGVLSAPLSPDAWTHTPAVPLVPTPVSSQRTSAFAALEPARHATVSVQRLPYGDDIGAAVIR
jgi:hypothetical protein